MNDFSHLEQSAENNEQAAKEDSLLHLTALAHDWQEAKDEYLALERQAEQAKKVFNKISQEDIPNTMMQVGLSEIKLINGQKVAYKEDVSCSIKDYDKLDAFLSERGEDGMMKITLEVGKVPKNILRMILQELSEKFEIQAVPKQFVHPATMAAYIRRLCGINGVTEAEVNVAEIDPEMLTVFRYYKTTVK
ncbi:MAG: hypothetical protein GY771_02880 [bacterium]|nr:hypothetical protein [bacterium]